MVYWTIFRIQAYSKFVWKGTKLSRLKEGVGTIRMKYPRGTDILYHRNIISYVTAMTLFSCDTCDALLLRETSGYILYSFLWLYLPMYQPLSLSLSLSLSLVLSHLYHIYFCTLFPRCSNRRQPTAERLFRLKIATRPSAVDSRCAPIPKFIPFPFSRRRPRQRHISMYYRQMYLSLGGRWLVAWFACLLSVTFASTLTRDKEPSHHRYSMQIREIDSEILLIEFDSSE